jgi:hypothetical protein
MDDVIVIDQNGELSFLNDEGECYPITGIIECDFLGCIFV